MFSTKIDADLSLTLDSLEMGVVLLDRDLRVMVINRAFFTIWKAAEGSLGPGDHFRKLIDINRQNGIYPVRDGDWEDYIAMRLDEIVEGNVRTRELERADGVCLTYSVTNLSEGRRLISYFDITEQKLNEQILAREKEKSVALREDLIKTINSLDMGIVVVDSDMKVQLLNSAFGKIWKTPEDAFKPGDHLRVLMDANRYNNIYDVREDGWEDYISSRLAEIRQGDVAPREFARADGVTLIYSVTNLSEGRRLISYFDITEQKQRELDLEKAQFEAQAAERAKSEFLANMSHEIRTPMNGVLGMAELLSRTELDPKQKMFADMISRSGASLLTTINDVLDFSKIEAGQLSIQPAPFNLTEAIEDVASLLASVAAEKNVELITRVAPDTPAMLLGDVARIRQILTNLVGNAIKFTEHGHVYVNVSGLEATGGNEASPVVKLRICVEDTGIGIAEGELERVFQKFQQADGSATRKHEGTGLGLSIASSLVELMGGEIGASSEQGAGSVFWFELPLPVVAESAGVKATPKDVTGACVLAVDDNPVNRSILSEQLSNWGFEVVIAANGDEALAILRAFAVQGVSVDCMILDHHMPEMCGAEVVKALKSELSMAHIPVIMLTSVDATDDGTTFLSLGIQAHLTKPARSTVLFKTLVSVLQEAGDKRSAASTADEQAGTQPGSDLHRSVPERGNDPVPPPGGPIGKEKQSGALVQSATSSQNGNIHQDTNGKDSESVDVLVCEDNQVNQVLFSEILRLSGWTFRIANHGKEGVEFFVKYRPALILMDVSMPEMDGYCATQEIRKIEGSAGGRTPIIGITAHAMVGDLDKCLDADMDDYLPKPVSPGALEEKIRRWYDKAQKQTA